MQQLRCVQLAPLAGSVRRWKLIAQRSEPLPLVGHLHLAAGAEKHLHRCGPRNQNRRRGKTRKLVSPLRAAGRFERPPAQAPLRRRRGRGLVRVEAQPRWSRHRPGGGAASRPLRRRGLWSGGVEVAGGRASRSADSYAVLSAAAAAMRAVGDGGSPGVMRAVKPVTLSEDEARPRSGRPPTSSLPQIRGRAARIASAASPHQHGPAGRRGRRAVRRRERRRQAQQERARRGDPRGGVIRPSAGRGPLYAGMAGENPAGRRRWSSSAPGRSHERDGFGRDARFAGRRRSIGARMREGAAAEERPAGVERARDIRGVAGGVVTADFGR